MEKPFEGVSTHGLSLEVFLSRGKMGKWGKKKGKKEEERSDYVTSQ